MQKIRFMYCIFSNGIQSLHEYNEPARGQNLKNREALDSSALRKIVLGRLRKFKLINGALHYENALVPLNSEFERAIEELHEPGDGSHCTSKKALMNALRRNGIRLPRAWGGLVIAVER